MARKPNDIKRFWHELKRRNVIQVIAAYAAVSFIILQLVDFIAEPLRLPVSTKALVIVLLCIGFIVAIFLSWVYDVTTAGIKKTKSLSTIRHYDSTVVPASNGWKIATYVSIIIVVALATFDIVTRKNLTRDRTGSEISRLMRW